MKLIEAPRCIKCGRIYVDGRQGICFACIQRRRKRSKRTRRNPISCDCGKPAVTVLLVRLGMDQVYTERMPLCAACLKLERETTQLSSRSS